ncbi:MAG: hypothetical protein AB7W59_12170 [Acidimicrobiia bacterium]
MRTRRRLLASSLTSLALLTAACGDDGSTAVGEPAPVTTAPPASSKATVEHADVGEHGDEHAHSDEHDEHDHGAMSSDGVSTEDLPPGAEEVDEAALRLLVADGSAPTVQVLDLADGLVLDTITLSGPATLTREGAGRYAIAAQRGADRVDLIDGGSVERPHGDHSHFYAGEPSLTGAGFAADDPTHVVPNHGLVAVFDDGDGTVRLLDAAGVTTGEVIEATIASGPAHHGVAVPAGEVVIVSRAAGELPDGVRVLRRDGTEVATFGDCPQLHGEVATHDAIAFGCADGVLVLEGEGETWTARKIANPPGLAADQRVGTLHGEHDLPYAVGNLGAGALARVDLAGGTIAALPLPLPMAAFAFHGSSGHALVVAADGQAHRVDVATGAVVASVAAVSPVALEAGHGGAPRPSIAIAGNRAYVSDPAGGVVIELGIADGELRVARRLAVDGAPASLLVLGHRAHL